MERLKLLKKGSGNFDYYLDINYDDLVISFPKPEAKKNGCVKTIFGSIDYFKKMNKNFKL